MVYDRIDEKQNFEETLGDEVSRPEEHRFGELGAADVDLKALNSDSHQRHQDVDLLALSSTSLLMNVSTLYK